MCHHRSSIHTGVLIPSHFHEEDHHWCEPVLFMYSYRMIGNETAVCGDIFLFRNTGDLFQLKKSINDTINFNNYVAIQFHYLEKSPHEPQSSGWLTPLLPQWDPPRQSPGRQGCFGAPGTGSCLPGRTAAR